MIRSFLIGMGGRQGEFEDYDGPALKFHRPTAAFSVSLFAFDCAAYGFAAVGIYVLKRSVGLDTFIGIDMVPDASVTYVLKAVVQWIVGMHWVS